MFRKASSRLKLRIALAPTGVVETATIHQRYQCAACGTLVKLQLEFKIPAFAF